MKQIFDPKKEEAVNRENVYYWMNKYISLLEKYNELLIQQAQKQTEEREQKMVKGSSSKLEAND